MMLTGSDGGLIQSPDVQQDYYQQDIGDADQVQSDIGSTITLNTEEYNNMLRQNELLIKELDNKQRMIDRQGNDIGTLRESVDRLIIANTNQTSSIPVQSYDEFQQYSAPQQTQYQQTPAQEPNITEAMKTFAGNQLKVNNKVTQLVNQFQRDYPDLYADPLFLGLEAPDFALSIQTKLQNNPLDTNIDRFCESEYDKLVTKAQRYRELKGQQTPMQPQTSQSFQAQRQAHAQTPPPPLPVSNGGRQISNQRTPEITSEQYFTDNEMQRRLMQSANERKAFVQPRKNPGLFTLQQQQRLGR